MELDADDAIEIEDVLAAHVDGALVGVQTALPGVVVAVDLARQRLAVRPTGGRSETNPDTGASHFRRFATIEEVPICYPQSKGYGMTFPVAVGDQVLLVFGSHSLDEWAIGRDDAPPRDPRRHHLTDAIAIPGVGRAPVLDASAKALVIHGTEVRIGGPSATARAARDVDLQQLYTILHGAADGVGYGSAVKAALDAAGWPACTSTVRLK